MLATEMEDLTPDEDAIAITLTEMKELFSDYNDHLSMLFERIQEQLMVITADLADIAQRLPRQ